MTASIRACLLMSALALAGLTAAFVDPPAEPAPQHAGSEDHVWTYSGERGPQAWGSLEPGNVLCSSGAQQSPVDLAAALDARAPQPEPHWIPFTGGRVMNTGHTIAVEVTGGGGVRLNGKDYTLQQFHFHHPSEHVVGGVRFPLEAHFVHAADDGDLAVIGVLFEEGAANPVLDPVWATAPGRAGQAAVAFQIDVAAFMPTTNAAYRYEGSLTTPPCSETVSWTVMAEPVTASKGQIIAFGTLFPDNARPLQPLNRRFILRTSE